ncbi:hypothetical protein BHM03_00022432 [Ensete ventricosum]|nr:hypothetical protein BHM03_00022432 [Ensete ventricosum]
MSTPMNRCRPRRRMGSKAFRPTISGFTSSIALAVRHSHCRLLPPEALHRVHRCRRHRQRSSLPSDVREETLKLDRRVGELNEYSVLLRSLTNIRESLYSRLNDELAEKVILPDITHLMQMAITSERLHKQSMVIRQICRLFPMRRVVTFSSLTQHLQLQVYGTLGSLTEPTRIGWEP